MTEPPIIRPFPLPATERLRDAYHQLVVLENGNPGQQAALGDPEHLPRPWDPATLTDPDLLAETWAWLEACVDWFNHEYVWDLNHGYIPACWPQHPHLVHEIGTLMDLRRRAGRAATSQELEEWHRYAVPTFLERLKQRTRDSCDNGHQPWPGNAKHTKYGNTRDDRERRYHRDIERAEENYDDTYLTPPDAPMISSTDSWAGRLTLVTPTIDPHTGELLDY